MPYVDYKLRRLNIPYLPFERDIHYDGPFLKLWLMTDFG